jgi:cobalamin biosynthesis protein CobT
MASGTMVNKDIHAITSDMAWLTAYYDFVVEAEGIAVARKVLNDRFFDDNMFLLKSTGVIKTTNNNEARALALRVKSKFFGPIYEEIVQAENTLALLGIDKEFKQTPRSTSIQMLIEIYKKRHDALLKTYNVTGGRRSD